MFSRSDVHRHRGINHRRDYTPQQFSKVVTGRRAAARLRVRLPGTLTLLSGPMGIVLENLSELGARISYGISQPPDVRVGSDAVLQWHRFEVFCQICWTAPDGCGVMFEAPIGRRELMLTRAFDEKHRLPEDQDLRRGIARRWVDGTL